MLIYATTRHHHRSSPSASFVCVLRADTRPLVDCCMGNHGHIHHRSLRLLSEKGLCSRKCDAVLPRFDPVDSSTMGLMGTRRSRPVSYEVIRCDIVGRGASREEASANGLLGFAVGEPWPSVGFESRSLAELCKRACCPRSCSSSKSESLAEARLPLRARACAISSSEEASEYSVMGRAEERGTSGVLTSVRSVLVTEPVALRGGVSSLDFFFVMCNARTGPS